ncbi:unnamed protein product [Arctia plantaginis]|uniref:Helicase C-terminal domain-containing protein n=1 Tax=Arctia plantaginis TaxID=874455 RepID=A0A8S0ZQT6_ARCPL|nr:unnamed protein product [Arctia plantaginis]
MSGVGCHHAGLLYEERHVIERAFRNRDLPILITTTTLAMGVNLPAHLVIVKNTQQYVNGTFQKRAIRTCNLSTVSAQYFRWWDALGDHSSTLTRPRSS